MIIVRVILIPLSLLYSFFIYLRNKFYDTGIFRSYKISKPVISIGNITTGGTGKTPFTIFTSKYFLEKGFTTGIIARGYNRKSEELVVVCDGKTINESVEYSGDELVMTAKELSGYKGKYFIIASADRVMAAEYMTEKFDPDIIILDDGFQHRRLKRDLDIVLIDSGSILKNKFLNSFTLPSGLLRENFKNISRAGLIIQNNKDKDISLLPSLERYNDKAGIVRYKTEYLINYKNSILETGKKSIAAIIFSGIADETSFEEMIKGLNISIKENIIFKDHHNYSVQDIDHLKRKYSDNLIFITTEKDFIKIINFKSFISEYPVYFLKIGITLEKNSETVYNELDKMIK